MLSLQDIFGINIEVSSLCNARCPFCSRSKKVRPYGPHQISFTEFKLLPGSLLEHVEWFSFGGNFGDLSTNNEMTQIAGYIKKMNPATELHGDSNGTGQDSDWWGTLGRYFRDGVMFFALDGLEDTHSIHRKGCNFKKVLENVRAFTGAGGVACWKFILFQHNEHQVEQAEKIAKAIGCRRFMVVSSREYSDELLRPKTVSIEIKDDIFARYRERSIAEQRPAVCKPIGNKSIYIAADGTVHPCCLAHCMYVTEHDPSFQFVVPLIDKYIDQINFKTRPLDEIIQGPYFETVLEISKNNPYCMLKCNTYKKLAQQELILRDIRF